MRKMLTDTLWDVIRSHVRPAGRRRCGAKPQVSDRVFLEALFYIARTGCPWRDLPAQFGAWDAAYNRFRRWVANGRLRRLFLAATEKPELGELPRLLIDSTIVRAHQHAAGAPRKKRAKGPTPRRRPKASAPAVGGESSKIIAIVSDENTVIDFDVAPGQRHDATLLEPLLAKAQRRVQEVEELVGDKGFDGRPQRAACLDRGVMPMIPGRSNQVEPAEVYPEAYKQRNKIGRLFGKMKHFRRAATRYDKLKSTYKGILNVVFAFLRTRAIVNRT